MAVSVMISGLSTEGAPAAGAPVWELLVDEVSLPRLGSDGLRLHHHRSGRLLTEHALQEVHDAFFHGGPYGSILHRLLFLVNPATFMVAISMLSLGKRA